MGDLSGRRPPSRLAPMRGRARGAQGFDPLHVRPRISPFRGQPLSERDRQVLALIAEGCTRAEAGRRMYLSPHTIDTHMEHIRIKLGTRTAAHAVAVAIARGEIDVAGLLESPPAPG